LIKGFPRTTTTTTTTKQNVDPAVHEVYSRVKRVLYFVCRSDYRHLEYHIDKTLDLAT
jgi:hypothetical protein